jgi:hypothetical protein
VKYSKQTETGSHNIVWSANEWRYSLRRTGNNYRFQIYDTATGAWQVAETKGITFQQDVWYHIAATYRNNDKIRMYVNGVLNNETSIPDITLNTQAGYIRIGVAQNIGAGGEWFDGAIDEVIIYDSALLGDEIRSHYARAFPQNQKFVNFVSESVYPLDGSAEKVVVEQGSRYVGGSMAGKSVPLAAINWGVEKGGRAAWMSSAPLNVENRQLLKSLVIWSAGENDYDIASSGELEERVKASMLKVLTSDMHELVRVDLSLGYFY